MNRGSYYPTLPVGTEFIGKWHKNRYVIDRLLGIGANGQVYRVHTGKSVFALKVGFDPVDLQSEVNVLNSLGKDRVTGDPFLIESDDFLYQGESFPFYVMKYVNGSGIREFIQTQGNEWLPLAGYRLLQKLGSLHDAGWVFGDLKPENVIVHGYGQIELIDYGGVTPTGRSVKQYTERYDRGYWAAGTRTADAHYDLFSYAVLCIELTDGDSLQTLISRLLPQERNPQQLLALVRENPVLNPFRVWFERALRQGFASSAEAREEWRGLMQVYFRGSGQDRQSRWPMALFIASLLLFSTTLYWMMHP